MSSESKPTARSGLRDSDLLLFSYPRSGNTWLRRVIADLLLQAAGTPTSTELPDFGRIVPTLHKHDLDALDPAADWGARLVKTHALEDVGAHRFLLVFREPTDAMASYHRFYHRGEREAFDAERDAFCVGEIPAWLRLHEAALELAKTRACTFVSFRRLHAEPEACVARTMAFLGRSDAARPDGVRRALLNQQLERVRASALRRGVKSASYNIGASAIGGGRARLGPACRKEIDARCGPLLARLIAREDEERRHAVRCADPSAVASAWAGP